MAISIVSVDPTNQSNNIPLNKVIKVIFSITSGATSIDSTTLIPANFALKHTKSSFVVSTSVTYDSAVSLGGGNYTQAVYITPTSLFFKNSSYTLKIIGYSATEVYPTTNIKDSAGNNLSGISIYSFISGDDIEVSEGQKTNAEQAFEGDLRLPSSLKLTQYANFQLVKATPQDHSWGITGQSITLEFNRRVDTGTITGSILIGQYPFLDQDGWFAKVSTGSANSGAYVFQFDTAAWSSNASNFFDLPTWTVTSTGKYVYLNTPDTLLGNARIEIDILSTLSDYTGNTLLNDDRVIYTTYSYPDVITPRTIRAEIPSVFDGINPDFMHEIIWGKTIEAYRCANYNGAIFNSRGQNFRDFVKYGALSLILTDLILPNALMAGQTKTLGDFTVSYHSNAGVISQNSILKKYEDMYNKAKKRICWSSQVPLIFIKGIYSVYDPPMVSKRLWINPRTDTYSDERETQDIPAANTYTDRDYKLPGIDDIWI